MTTAAWIVLLAPLAGFLIIAFTSQVLPWRAHGWIGHVLQELLVQLEVGIRAWRRRTAAASVVPAFPFGRRPGNVSRAVDAAAA